MKMMTPTPTIKSHHYECCMCGDHGLSHLLFRCSVCHFRSQHRYCSNLYPKADTYRVCNWCLIQQHNVDDHHNLTSISSSPQDQAKTTAKTTNYNNKKLKLVINHQNGEPSPKWLQPTTPIKKPIKPPPESRSPSGRKRITAQAQQEEIIRSSSILRRTKSSEAITSSTHVKMKKNNDNSNNNNNNKKWEIRKKNESGGGEGTSGDWNGPTQDRDMGVGVIKHVYRNKVRRYKLLDEVSS